jgi:hemolysin activation/secretion protein
MKRKNTIRARLLTCAMPVILIMSLPGQALAISVPSAQTGTASPARAQKEFGQEKVAVPAVAPHVEVQEPSPVPAPKGADKIKLKLADVTLEGNTVYKEKNLAPIYRNKIGQTITLADVYGIASDLTRKYRNDGYVLTQVVVPPQEIKGGHVRLRVVEGFIDRVEIQGSDSPAAIDQIRNYANHVRTGGRALNVKRLERALLLINDLPGARARGVLSPSKNVTGAADLLIVLEKRKRYDAKIGIDNYGSKFLGPWELTGAVALNSLLGHNDRITVQVVEAPDKGFDSELFYAGIDYEQPLFDNGMIFELFANNTNTTPGFTLEQFDVHGTAFAAGARLKYPFVRTRSLTDVARLTFDINNVDTSNNIEPDRTDRVRSARLGNKLEFLDTIFGASYNVFDVEASHGLDIWGARDDSNIDMSRANADPDYSKITAEIQRLQHLSANTNLLVAASGQYSDSLLYTSEQFGIGGPGYGRTYDPSEILGDSGIAGKLELQYNQPYRFLRFNTQNQFFAYYDIGRTWTNDANTAAVARASLATMGFGVRSTIDDATSLGLLVGVPLTKGYATDEGHSPRVLVGLYRKI